MTGTRRNPNSRQGWVDDVTMSGFVPDPARVLFTTAPRDVYLEEKYDGDIPCITSDGRLDWFAHHPLAYPLEYQPSVKSRAYEVAFLEANVPGPTYLHLPTQAEIEAHLASGDFTVLAITSYTWTLPWALDMAERARRDYGVKEVWLGGYGVMTPEPKLRVLFDRLFWGYSESNFRVAIGLAPLSVREIEHPLLLNESTYLAHKVKIGHLFWRRGCTQHCTFCADPVFQPRGEAGLSMETIERMIMRYKEQGCLSIHLVNQDVQPFSAQGEQVIRILKRHQIPFTMMTSFQALTAKGDDGLKRLADSGLTMAQLGIESLSDINLSKSLKTTSFGQIERTVKTMDALRIRLSATYMLCFEDDTAQSISLAKTKLGDLGPIYTYFSIIQPMPGTPFFDDLHRRGLINDWDFRRWTGGYLVWKHPTIAPEEARELVREMDRAINTPLHNKRLKQEWDRIDRMRERMRERNGGEVPELKPQARVYFAPEALTVPCAG
jgi:Radical SAM superfamily